MQTLYVQTKVLECSCLRACVHDSIQTILNEKNRDSFKLSDLSTANKINNGTSHDAITDCLNSIDLAKIIFKKTNHIWNDALLLTTKKDTEN